MRHDCVIVRYGEIALKGGNKSMFEKKLKDNIACALERKRGISGKVRKISGRFIIDTEDANMAADVVKNVFGVTSTSPAVKLTSNLEEMENTALAFCSEAKPDSFRITANRLEKTFNFTSLETNKNVGEYVQKKTDCRVNLKNPGLNIGLDITKQATYAYTERYEGVGGLPVGVSGRVVCLLSGGIDSPVAAWLALKRGCNVTLVHFLHEEQDKQPQKITEIKEKLGEYAPSIRLLYVPVKELEKEIIMNVPAKLRIIVLRRMFMKMASIICGKENAKAIVTGDNIGQVASQTLDNMNVIDRTAGILTLRPLAGYDKQEIVDIARRIGTYETSTQSYTDCCSFLLPEHPETKATLGEVELAEQNINPTVIEKTLEKTYEG